MTPEIYESRLSWPERLLIAGGVAVMVLATFSGNARASIGDNQDRVTRSERYVPQQVKRHGSTNPASRRRLDVRGHARGRALQSVAEKKLAQPAKRSEQIVSADTGLVAKARSYIGTNPTGWRSLWCGRFMAIVAPAAARRVRNPNMARDWAQLPHVSAQVGSIVVLTRGPTGGHVGVVSGFDAGGNPKVISGNHNRIVAEAIYPKSRVIAYVAALEQVAMVRP